MQNKVVGAVARMKTCVDSDENYKDAAGPEDLQELQDLREIDADLQDLEDQYSTAAHWHNPHAKAQGWFRGQPMQRANSIQSAQRSLLRTNNL